MRRPRSTTRRRASSSVSTPATQAAVTSPTLWPITAAGSTPQARHCPARAHCRATRAGCTTAVARRTASSLEQQLGEGGAQVRREQGGAAVEGGPEGRLGLVELPPHAGPLGALAGEQEHHARRLAAHRPRAPHAASDREASSARRRPRLVQPSRPPPRGAGRARPGSAAALAQCSASERRGSPRASVWRPASSRRARRRGPRAAAGGRGGDLDRDRPRPRGPRAPRPARRGRWRRRSRRS